MTTDLATILTGGGAGSGVTALIAGLLWWRTKSADIAKVASDISRQVADDLRGDKRGLVEETQQLRAEVRACNREVGHLQERVVVLIGLINQAVPHLERIGVDVSEYRDAIRGGIQT